MATKSKLRAKLLAKRKELSDRSAGGAFLTLKEGTTRVRHLPVGEEKEFVVEVVYFYLGDKIKGVISPKSIGKKCAIMQMYEKLSASKDPKDRELAAKFKPGRKFFSPVLKYKDEDGKEPDLQLGPKMLALTPGLYQDILDLYLDEKEAGDFTDPKTGYDLKYKREGKGKQDTQYNVIKCKETPLTKSLRGKEFDPEELVKSMIPSYEETKQKIEEFLSAPPEDDEDEKPRKKKKKVSKDAPIKKKKKSRDL